MIYLDHNATSPLRPGVSALLRERFSSDQPTNPSSVHGSGREARRRLEDARAKVARLLGAEPKEVLFVSSGSEADALALKGAFRARADKSRRRVVTSAIEHPALLAAAAELEKEGAEVVRMAPSPDGRIPLASIEAALSVPAALCSLMWANNETGVLQPVEQVARLCRQRGVLFHTDAVQAAGRLPVTLQACDADLLSLSGHKVGAPPGIAVLVVRRGVNVLPLVAGHQEGGRRGGTPSVAFAEAFALAFEQAQEEAREGDVELARRRDRLEAELTSRLAFVQVNGAGAERLSNTSNLHFPGADGEALLIALDLQGVQVSTGAACASGSLSPSHVLTAMGLTSAQAHGSLRLSLGRQTTDAEIDRVVALLVEHVPRCRD